MDKELHQELSKLLHQVIPIINYKGVLITKTKEGFLVHGQKVKTEKEVDEIIQKGLNAIKQSII